MRIKLLETDRHLQPGCQVIIGNKVVRQTIIAAVKATKARSPAARELLEPPSDSQCIVVPSSPLVVRDFCIAS